MESRKRRNKETQRGKESKEAPVSDPIAGVSDTVSGAVSDAAVSVKNVLVKFHELPVWQQDNHYILSGYVKETLSYKKCVQSLTYLHNETGNIYTHLVPAVVCLVGIFVGAFKDHWTQDRLPMLFFLFGVLCCLGCSGTYHCLKAHSHRVSVVGNSLDYVGIVVLIETSMVAMICYGYHDNVKPRIAFTTITSIFGLICTMVSLDPKFRTPEFRPFRAQMFVLYGLSGLLPILYGFQHYGVEICLERIQVYWIVLEGLLYISGAVLYACRIPERFSPGSFDIWGHSHQLFHIFVVLAAICHGKAVYNAYQHQIRQAP